MIKRLWIALFAITLSFQTADSYSQTHIFLSFEGTGDWIINLLNHYLPSASTDSVIHSVDHSAHSALQIGSEEFEERAPWKNWSVVENYSFGKNRGSLAMITDLNALHPYFRDRIRELIAQCKAKGIELAIVETFRTHAKQNEYKYMGRNYTNSAGGRSKHQYGLAVDVVPIVNNQPEWDNQVLWRKIGLTGEKLGLRWGGRWKKPYDPGHFEWTGGLTSSHLSTGLLPSIPSDKYPCIDEDMEQLRQYWNEWESFQSMTTRK